MYVLLADEIRSLLYIYDFGSALQDIHFLVCVLTGIEPTTFYTVNTIPWATGMIDYVMDWSGVQVCSRISVYFQVKTKNIDE